MHFIKSKDINFFQTVPFTEIPFNTSLRSEKPFKCDWGRIKEDHSVKVEPGIKAYHFIYFDARCQSEWPQPWHDLIGLS